MWQARAQKIQSEFQQLGQDLQAGNLTQAQSDFSSLTQNISSPQQSNSPLAQAFSALGSALQSGNVTAAQQAYTALQQDVEQAGQGHHHHHHAGDSSQTTNSSSRSMLSQLFSSLGTALVSGNLSAAQTAYSTLSKDLTGLGWNSGTTTPSMAGALSFLG
ncbi:MAG TPA: hypothetical protein VKO18_16305 [Terriglobia bacterium]|nr:hypothetical protein [Terriglobia bacterium]